MAEHHHASPSTNHVDVDGDDDDGDCVIVMLQLLFILSPYYDASTHVDSTHNDDDDFSLS